MVRETYAIIFVLLTLALGVCAFFAFRSRKLISRPVRYLLMALIPPVIGNLIIILPGSQELATVGYYVYFLGMDLVMYALLNFTFQYCGLSWHNEKGRRVVMVLLLIDVAQYVINPLFHQAFTTGMITVEGEVYYGLNAALGQTYHRVLDYGIFAAVLIIFLLKMVRSPKIYMERYSVIFTAMIVIGLWESWSIFSHSPIDRSMIGFGVFGLLVFYFALYYRPMRLLDRMLVQVASHMEEAYFFFDAAERPIWANEAGMRLIGVEEEDSEQINELLSLTLGRIYLGKGNWREQRVQEDGDEKRYYLLEKQTMTDKQGKLAGSFLIVRDQTEDQQALQREKYNSAHDRLTGLYNREHLFDRIHWMVATHPEEKYLVMLTDVSNFKIINDIFGNQFGDQALIQIGQMIRGAVGDQGLYGRVAGDTFGICMRKDAFDQKGTERLLHRFTVSDENISHHVLIHMGVYEVQQADTDVSVMFDRARMALSLVKNDYNTVISWYSDKMREDALWDQYISSELQEAIQTRQIQPYLQPIVDERGRPVGAEALVRWIHPKHGFLSPAKFVPVFERNGMIADVDRYMWRSACEILARWKREGVDLFLSINVSPKDFYFMDVGQEIRAIVAEFGIEPARLRIEITETIMMTDMENRIRMLNELKEDGFLIEMDDFGSGYSSLNMLKDMPIDLIKIDMMFLKQARDDIKAQTILRNILHLSEELGIISLTEGVETESQYHMLAERGCNLFQGFYFARPMPVEEYDRYRLDKIA